MNNVQNNYRNNYSNWADYRSADYSYYERPSSRNK